MCGGSQKSKQSSTSTYTPQSQALGAYGTILDNSMALGDTPYNPATEKNVAGFTGDQNAAFQGIGAMQGNFQPWLTDATNMTQQAGQSVSPGDINNYMDPYLQQVVQATMGQVDQNNAMQQRQMKGNLATEGLGGNGAAVGTAELMRGQGLNRASTVADLMSKGWNSAVGYAQGDKSRQLQAGSQMGGLGQMFANLTQQQLTALLGAGNQQQAQQQAQNDAATQNAQAQSMYPLQMQQWLASQASGLGPLMGGTTTGSGTATTSTNPGIGQILGGAVTMAGMASDERVKEDITPVGKLNDGQQVYKYRYKGDPRWQIGLMAQEVEGSHPEAVGEGPGGMKMVNYDMATKDAEYADGGSVGPFGGMGAPWMGWAPLKGGSPIVPNLPDVRPPQAAQDGGFDPAAAYATGKKAGAGLGSLGNFLDPAGGWGAQTVPTASLGGGGGGGSFLSGLGGMLGFADGGAVDDDEYRRMAMELQPNVIQQESGGDPTAVSRTGARGLMQIQPETGRDPGYGVTPLRDDSDEENVRFGTDYLTAQLRRYKGDKSAALIAYNGGPARADAWLKAGRDDSVIPTESANYYKSVQGMKTTMAKAMTPEPVEGGQPYQSKSDAANGGMLHKIFGDGLNVFNLNEGERMALVLAGTHMMQTGNIGSGMAIGAQYLAGQQAGARDAHKEAQTLAMQLRKQQLDTQAAARGERREDRADAREERTAKTAEEDLKLRQETADRETTKLDRELQKPLEPTSDAVKQYEYAKGQGFQGTFTEFQAQGKKEPAAKIPGEIAARIAMGDQYIERLPAMQEQVRAITKADRADLALGRGKMGELYRKQEAGKDAILRMLTGAGQSVPEESAYRARYSLSATDTVDTMISKMNGLKEEIERVKKDIIGGQTGDLAKRYGQDQDAPTPVKTETVPGAPQAAGVANPKNEAEYQALPSGSRFIAPDGSERIKP